MKFDKTRFYTQVNADELQVGDKVIIANNAIELRSFVELDLSAIRLVKIGDESKEFRFWVENGVHLDAYRFAYLIERAPKEDSFRPFKDTNELIEYWTRKTGCQAKAYAMPPIWVKDKKDECIQIVLCLRPESVTVNDYACTVSMDKLLHYYTFLDGSPCGIKAGKEMQTNGGL